MSADTHPDLEDLSEAARAAANRGRHEEAAALWLRLGEDATVRGLADTASQSFALAGDALRREDRPVAAARSLQRALDLLDPSGDRGRADLIRAELAAVLLDLGEPLAAVERYRSLLAGGGSAGVALIALDGLIGALLGLGRVDDARGPFAELEQRASGPGRLALLFRRAAFLRLDGDLDGAAALHGQLRANLAEPRFAGARAASWHDSGEIALLRGDPKAARGAFAQAGADFAAAGRRIGAFRAELGLARTDLSRGLAVLPSRFDAMRRYAEERGLPVFQAEVLLAQGNALAARGKPADAPLAAAQGLAEAAGMRFLAGRVALAQWRATGDGAARNRARALLVGDQPWRDEVEASVRSLW